MAAKPFGPDYRDVVVDVIRRNPSINPGGEDDERGRIVDHVAINLNGGTVIGPWGRKARNRDGSNKNGDGLTYLHAGGRFEIVDILKGLDDPPEDRTDYADFTPKGNFGQGENGYWTNAGGTVVEPPTSEGITEDRVRQLIEDAVAPLREELKEAIKYGDKLALQCNKGTFLCAEGGGPELAYQEFWFRSRDAVDSWESFKTHRGK